MESGPKNAVQCLIVHQLDLESALQTMPHEIESDDFLPTAKSQLSASPIDDLLWRFIVDNGVHEISERGPLLLLRLLAHVMR